MSSWQYMFSNEVDEVETNKDVLACMFSVIKTFDSIKSTKHMLACVCWPFNKKKNYLHRQKKKRKKSFLSTTET